MRVERFDALCQPLPGEPPGEPVPGGPWAVARRLVEEYRMADPAIVRARWDPDEAFVGRVMVLQLRLWRLLHVRARARDARLGRGAGGRRPPRAGVRVRVRDAARPSRDRPDGLRGAEVPRRRRGPVPVARALAGVRRRRVVGADRVPALRPARAGAVLLPVLCADRAADGLGAGAPRSTPPPAVRLRTQPQLS